MTDTIQIQNSIKGYDSTNAPFFRECPDNDDDRNISSESVIPMTISNKTNDEIYKINIFSDFCDNKEIQDFIINNNGIDREIYLNNWTFLSMQKILELIETYEESNIKNVVDLGFIYQGMGWILVAFYYNLDSKIYFRMDGGSNGWDRLDNFNKLKDVNKNISNNSSIGINFKDFLNRVNNNLELPSFII